MKKLLLIVLFTSVQLAAQSVMIDSTAPGFTLQDINGKEYSLSDHKGKYIVLEWINFGCPFVKKHYNSGKMQELQKKYTEKGVTWFAICSSAEGKQGHLKKEELEEKTKELKTNFTAYLIDEDGTVGKLYGAKTTPQIFIIDPEGALIYAGAADDTRSTKIEDIKTAKNYIDEALTAAMNKKEIKIKSSKPYGCSVKY